MTVAAGTAVFTPRSVNELFSPRGQLLFRPTGSDRDIVLAEAEDFEVTPELTESEYRSKSYPKSMLVKKSVFATSLNMSTTLKSLTGTTLAALFMGRVDGVLLQPAVTAAEVSFSNPARGDIFDLGAFDVTVVSVESNEIAWVEGENYSVDVATGRVEVLSVPDGATTIAITFSASAITESDARQALGILETEGLRGKLTFRELGAEGPFNWVAEYWDVELRPSGGIAHLGGDEFASIELSGSAYASAGKPAGQEYGRVVVLPKR